MSSPFPPLFIYFSFCFIFVLLVLSSSSWQFSMAVFGKFSQFQECHLRHILFFFSLSMRVSLPFFLISICLSLYLSIYLSDDLYALLLVCLIALSLLFLPPSLPSLPLVLACSFPASVSCMMLSARDVALTFPGPFPFPSFIVASPPSSSFYFFWSADFDDFR